MRRKQSLLRKTIFVFPILVLFVYAAEAYFPESKEKKQVEQQKIQNINIDNKTDSLSAEVVPDTVKIGVYILSVYDLDFPGNKVNVDFYLWYNAKKDSLNLLQYMEIINSTEFHKSGETDEKRGNIIYQTVRVNARIKEEWNVTNFPFDKQTVEIIVEDFDKDNTKLIFTADSTGSKMDKSVHIEGWKIEDFGIKVADNTYETSYGDPDLALNEYSTYSRAVVHFTIVREGNGLFFKLFIGLFISVLISLLTFFINPLDLDPRFGLSVGAIFAAIASQYVIASSLPQNATLTLVDILHDISFIFIFLCILVSTISLHYMKINKAELSQKIDRYSFFPLAISYVVLVVYFVVTAIK